MSHEGASDVPAPNAEALAHGYAVRASEFMAHEIGAGVGNSLLVPIVQVSVLRGLVRHLVVRFDPCGTSIWIDDGAVLDAVRVLHQTQRDRVLERYGVRYDAFDGVIETDVERAHQFGRAVWDLRDAAVVVLAMAEAVRP